MQTLKKDPEYSKAYEYLDKIAELAVVFENNN
jgi:hypothetical protein